MDKQSLIQGLKSLIEDRQCFVDEKDPDCVFKEDIEYLEEAIRIIEEAPEVPVREQFLSINKRIKFIQVSQSIYFISIMAIVSLMFYRFNKSFQGFIDIFQGNTDITRTMIDLLQTITNILT